MVWQRVFSAFLAAPLVLLAAYLGGPVWPLLLLGLGAAAWLELQHLVQQPVQLFRTTGLVLLVISIGAVGVNPGYILPTLVLSLLTFMAMQLVDYDETKWPAAALAISSYFYLGLPLIHLLLLRTGTGDWRFVLLALLDTWAYDVFAFFAGRNFGRVRPWIRISPKKSVEGLIGGMVGSVSMTLVMLKIIRPGLSPLQWLLISLFLGLGVGTLAHLGDLAESAIKRAYKVKDSGHFLPGHGGLLDRMDSVLFVAPFVYYVVSYLLL